MQGRRREFSTVQIIVPENIACRIREYGMSQIKDESVCYEGREENIHLTILYGIISNDSAKVAEVIRGTKPFEVSLGIVSSFRGNAQFDVAKIDVRSDGAVKLNRILRENLPFESNFPVYKPHLTIAYVKKGKCTECERDDLFKNESFFAKSVWFRPINGSNIEIPLDG